MKSDMMIIVNADDFGMDSSVNGAVCHCFEKGYISSTTVMVNMPGAVEAAALSREQGFMDRVGLHLNLTAGFPLTEYPCCHPLLCREDGSFNAAFHLSTVKRLRIDEASSEAVGREVREQLVRFRELGFKGGHFDSHHHVHTDAAIWRVVSPLLKEYGFTSVRIGRNMYVGGRAGAANRLYKLWLNSTITRAGFATTDYFGSAEDFLYAHDALPSGASAEIMVHPLPGETGIHDNGVLMSDTARRIAAYGSLSGYGDLL